MTCEARSLIPFLRDVNIEGNYRTCFMHRLLVSIDQSPMHLPICFIDHGQTRESISWATDPIKKKANIPQSAAALRRPSLDRLQATFERLASKQSSYMSLMLESVCHLEELQHALLPHDIPKVLHLPRRMIYYLRGSVRCWLDAASVLVWDEGRI